MENVFDRKLEPQERMLRVVLLLSALLSVLGITECIIILDVEDAVFPLAILLIAMIISLYAMIKRHKVTFAANVVGAVVIVLVFPTMFFLSGGLQGGAAVWFVLSMFYVFMMFSGKRFIVFFIITLLVESVVYGLAYHHPEFIVPLANKNTVFLDSFFSIVAVGIATGGVLKLQVKLYEAEREELALRTEELEKISKSKNEFFANMSHEIRTPINTIVGLNEMILRQNKDNEIREYAENIQIASEMLLSLVNDILDLSQVEIKRMELIPTEYQTRKLFEELVDMTQMWMREKELEFIVDIDRNLPSALIGDEKRTKQILLNILSNAVKYTKEGSVILSAHGEYASDGELLFSISVEDTGIGIRKEDIEHLYDAFERVDQRKNYGVEGSGLGLAISKQLVDLMNGEITVDSVYMQGSVFTVNLKVKVADATPMGVVEFLQKEHGNRPAYYKQTFEASEARVLIVDDNEVNTMVLGRLLKETKMQIDVAKGGAACLDMAKKKYYHVILMDYMMPGMNGVETLKQLRSQENGLCRESAVIILTADILNGTSKFCRDNGFDGYLEKPIQTELLEAEILKFLPDEIVEYRMREAKDVGMEEKMQQITRRKKKRIYVTSDCVCDLPEEMLEKYDVKLMYLYIKTRNGRFADTREIDSDNMAQYITEDECYVRSDGVTVEEYEEFFSDMLTRAENVVHISMAANASGVYQVAQQAAKGFDHVHVMDSGQISGGEGLVVLYAAKLALEGASVTEICEAIERIKNKIKTKILIPTSKVFYNNGYTNRTTMKICSLFGLHPVLTMRQSKIIIVGTRIGKLENAWKRYIRYHLRRVRKIDTGVVFITHVGCSVKQQEMIREEVLKCVPFEKVYMHKASFSTACNGGIHSIGIAYYTKM